MCKFCDDLSWRRYKVPYRTNTADDNSCEYGSPDGAGDCTCTNCFGCSDVNLYFDLKTFYNSIGFDFVHHIKDLVIEPSSEMIVINYCPWCGKKLTEGENIPFEKCYMGHELSEVIHF